jgi:hypothetical protein
MARKFIPNPEFQGKVLVLIANSGIASLTSISSLKENFRISIPGVGFVNDVNTSNVTLVNPDNKNLIETTCKESCKTVKFAQWLKTQPKRFKPAELLKKVEKYGFTIASISQVECI